jgi:hypothetical protein
VPFGDAEVSSNDLRNAAAIHSHKAHVLLMAEEALYEAYRKTRYYGVAFSDPNMQELSDILKREWKNTGAKRRRVMRKKK